MKSGTVGWTSRQTWLMLGLLMAAAAIIWLAATAWPDGRLHIVFLDVGQGDAVLIRTPHGRQVLIDGGPSPALLLDELASHLPFYDRYLDVVLLSHPQADHMTGQFAVFDRYRVGLVVDPGGDPSRGSYAAWLRAATADGARVVRARNGQVIQLEGSLRLEVLHAAPATGDVANENENSLVVRLTDGRFAALFPGDLPASQQALLPRAQIRSAVLKVPHHGAADGVDGRFLAAVQPRLAIISVGKENRFGHPAPPTTALLVRRDVRVYRTDEDGTVDLVVTGETLRVRTER